MASQQKLVNGLDVASHMAPTGGGGDASEMSPAGGGFRHQLPQMTVMTKNPKIAHSKAAANTDVVGTEHSTTDVEGVGKVVHIGSELMEVDDSAEKLLDQLEGDPTESKEKAAETVEPSNNNGVEADCDKSDKETIKNTNDVGDNITDTNSEKTKNKEKEESEVVKQDKPGGSKAKTEPRAKRKSTSPVKADKTSPIIPPESSPLKENTPKRRKSAKEVAAPSKSESISSSDETGSPNKRQRKPKKFEDEEVAATNTPKTPAEKLTKPKVEATPELEAKYPVKWLVGDLVWAKVATHPWWPCMVSYDPFSAVYTRIHRSREYHVQFFGDAAERAWISMNNLLEFQGKKHFDEYVEGLYSTAKNAKESKRLKKWYGVLPNRLKAVTIGINQAEEALLLTRKERKAKYTFVYQLPKSKVTESVNAKLSELEEDLKIIQRAEKGSTPSETKHSTKRKHDEVATPTQTPKSGGKRRKVETPAAQEKTETPVKSGKKSTSVSRPVSGIEGCFEVFCQKERENVLAEHPEFSDEMLLDYCRQQWCMMSKKQKGRYKSKYTDTEESEFSGDVSPVSGRRRKPSQKVIEAEESNKVVEEVTAIPRRKSITADSKGSKPVSAVKETKSRKSAASEETVKSAPNTPQSQLDKKETKSESKRRKGRPSKAATEMLEAEPASTVPNATIKTEPPTTEVSSQDNQTEGKRKKGRQSKAAAEVPEAQSAPTVQDATVKTEPPTTETNASVIPAKRAKPKKSLSSESDKQSDRQSDSGRSTPSPTPQISPTTKREKEEYEYEMEIYKLSSAGPQKKENLCQICEQTGELLECQGPCQGFFHIDCLGLTTAPEGAFKCDECTNGIHSCFICKKSSADTQRCCIPVCGKFYHVDCVKQYPQAKVDAKGITCPLHNCHTCLANNLKASATKTNGRLLRCVRCPTAYHVGDFCISAGSINLTGFNIVCARHFQPIPSMKHHTHVHVSWCFSCNKGGTLLCCESCPAAYHAECLNIEFPTGAWYCQDCVKGKRPLYGEIIWVKLGNYRWWPGEICHPRNVPLNIQEKPHQVGEFPVHFLGSHEYFWLHQGRVFSFQDGDKGAGGSSSNKGLAKHFTKGLKEANEAFKVWKEFRDNREQLELAKESKKPAPFKMVKNNIPLGSVVIKKADLSELPKCECKPDQENPCGRDSECLNAMMMYECHPALCPAGEKCQNQFFTKRLYPPQQPYKTEGRGWGLKAMADIKKGQFVNEYVGDLIDEEECKRRLEKAHEDDVHNFYMMTLDMDRIIDAGPKGNLSRFMNHCCDPNLETQKWNVNGDVRVGLFAMKDIKEGDELTFNYNFDCLGNEQTKCQCGAENCSGYLGVRPKTQAAAIAEMKRKDVKKGDKSKKKKKVVVKRKHDDDCFRCGEGGELVMCDRAGCTKTYHLRCLGLAKPPHGKWDCPWHHCDDCGKMAAQKCAECPNSYCNMHADGNTRVFDNKIYCMEHEELLETLEESQSQTSAASDDTGDISDLNGSDKTVNGKKDKDSKATKVKGKEETLPPKKRGPKPQTEATDKPSNGTEVKTPRGRKASVKGDSGSKGALKITDDTLAVAPMFDDDDEEEDFGLVIDIPNF